MPRRKQKEPECYLQYRSKAFGKTVGSISQQVIRTVYLTLNDIVVAVEGRSIPVVYFQLNWSSRRVYMFEHGARSHKPQATQKKYIGDLGHFVYGPARPKGERSD